MPKGLRRIQTSDLHFLELLSARAALACGFVLLFIASDYISAQATKPVTLIIHLDAGNQKPPKISDSDLVIFDNDSRVTAVSEVAPALTRGADFAIVVDASGSDIDKVSFIKKCVVEVFDAATTSPNSEGLLFTFGNKIVGSNTWVSRTDVQQTMRSFTVEQGARSPLYLAVIQAAQRLATSDVSNKASRRLLFAVTDGDDSPSGVNRQDAINAALNAGISIIPIGLLSSGRERIGKENLTTLADATGGRAIILNGSAAVKPLLLDVLQSEYLVTYVPPYAARYHKIRIGLSPALRGVSVKAPIGYMSR